jgi:hypothetical protein
MSQSAYKQLIISTIAGVTNCVQISRSVSPDLPVTLIPVNDIGTGIVKGWAISGAGLQESSSSPFLNTGGSLELSQGQP